MIVAALAFFTVLVVLALVEAFAYAVWGQR